MNTGEIIKQLRLSRGMSQEELGKKIGVQKAAINKYEKGLVVNLKRETIAKLADALDTTPTILMGWDENGLNQDFSGVEPMIPVPMEQSTRGMTPEEREAHYRGLHLSEQKEKPIVQEADGLTEEELLRISAAMAQMNKEGRERAVELVEDLAAGGRFKKPGTDRMGKEA